jgi:hypothetical protein
LLNKILFGADVNDGPWYKGKKSLKKIILIISKSLIIIMRHSLQFFSDPYYSCISAIIFATANLEEPYNKDNTFLSLILLRREDKSKRFWWYGLLRKSKIMSISAI